MKARKILPYLYFLDLFDLFFKISVENFPIFGTHWKTYRNKMNRYIYFNNSFETDIKRRFNELNNNLTISSNNRWIKQRLFESILITCIINILEELERNPLFFTYNSKPINLKKKWMTIVKEERNYSVKKFSRFPVSLILA